MPLLLLLVGGGGGGRGAGGAGVALASGFASVPSTLHHHHRRTTVDDATCLESSSVGEAEAAPSSATSSSSSSSSSSSPSSSPSPFDVVSTRNWELLSARGRSALERLVSRDAGRSAQAHVYGGWPEIGVEDDGKIALAEQVSRREILSPPLRPFFPDDDDDDDDDDGDDGVFLSLSLSPFSSSSSSSSSSSHNICCASRSVPRCACVGGGGGGLGYSGIKLGLETNLLTGRCYLEVYCRYILAMQRMARNRLRDSGGAGAADENAISAVKIPLAIMTSDDTDPLTRKLLEDNDNFGFDEGQITIIKQDKVAALTSVDASLSMKSRWVVETKPHGHGDVHHLLHKSGLVDRWRTPDEYGHRVNHVIFLQDTNALVINSILPTLGVSIAKGYHMNSICIPRLAGEAAGAIARLE